MHRAEATTALLPIIEPERFRQPWRESRTSGVVMLATFLAAILLGIDVAVAVVVLLSAVVAAQKSRVKHRCSRGPSA